MKKLIAILAVFAVVAPALFAQDEGSWSVGGSGRITTMADFSPWELRSPENWNSDQTVVVIGGINRGWWQGPTGDLNLTYRKGGLETGLQFGLRKAVGAFAQFDNGAFRFRASADVQNLLSNPNGRNIGDLWGGYKFLDGMIDIFLAIKSGGGTGHWAGTTLVGDTYAHSDGSNFFKLNVAPISGLELGFILPGIFDVGISPGGSARIDGDQSSLTDLGFSNNPIRDITVNGGTYFTGVGGNSEGYRRFMQDSLERMTFGVKYATGPITAAAQYGLRGRPQFYEDEASDLRGTIRDATFLKSVLYLGVQYNITDAMMAAFEARGEFFKSFDNGVWTDGTVGNAADPKYTDVSRTALAIAGRFKYEASPLMTQLTITYFNDIWTAGAIYGGEYGIAGARGVEGGVVRLAPQFQFDIVPTHLRFTLASKLDIPLSEWYLARYDPYDTTYKNDIAEGDDLRGKDNSIIGGTNSTVPNNVNIRAYSLGYEVQPSFNFNFLGTGAGGDSTAIIARYTLNGLMFTGELWNKRAGNPSTNTFDIMFSWSF